MKTTALIALLALPLSAQTVNPDRPYLTYFACTPDKGATQVELGGYRAQADDKSVFTSTPVLVRYGLFENFEVRHLLEHMTDMGYLVDIPAVSLVIKPSELGVVMHCTGEGDVVVELQVKPPVEAAHIDVTVKDWTDRPTSGM